MIPFNKMLLVISLIFLLIPKIVFAEVQMIHNNTNKTNEIEEAHQKIMQLSKNLEAVINDLSKNSQEQQIKYSKVVSQKQSVDWLITFFKVFDDRKSLADNKEALAAIEKAIELAPEYSVPYAFKILLYGDVEKNYQKKIEDLSTAIKYFTPDQNNLYENKAILYVQRGQYYMRQKELLFAMEDFMSSLDIDPNQVLRTNSGYEGLDINVFVKKYPKDYRSYIIRACYYSVLERQSDNQQAYDNSNADINKAIRLNDKYPIAYYVITETLGFRANKYEAMNNNKIDTVSRNAIVDATTKGIKITTTDDWKKRFFSIRAQQYIILKKYKLAIDDYNYIVKFDPENAVIYHDRAIAYKELGRFDEALNDLNKAINITYDSYGWTRTVYEIMARIHESMDKYSEVIKDYTNAYNIWEKESAQFYKEYKIGSYIPYEILNKRAKARRKIGDNEKAIDDYHLAILWAVKVNHMIYGEIADTYMEMKSPEKALPEFDRAISLNKNESNKEIDKADIISSSYYLKKALAYSNIGNTYLAIDSCNKALNEIDYLPGAKEEIYLDMGLYYVNLGKDKEALKCYREAVRNAEIGEKSKASLTTYSCLAQKELDMGNTKEAFIVFDKTIILYPYSQKAYDERGNAHLMVGNYNNAIHDFNKVLDVDPTNQYAYYNRGIAYKKIGREDMGIGDIMVSARLGNRDAINMLNSKKFKYLP